MAVSILLSACMTDLYSFKPIFAGIIGTAIMTLFTEVTFFSLKRPYHVVRTLALIFAYGKHAKVYKRPGTSYYLLATFIHYTIGVLFSYLYRFAITYDLIGFPLTHTILFGGAIGTVGIAGWKVFLASHRHPLHYSLKIYFSIIWMGHIFLALTLFYIYE